MPQYVIVMKDIMNSKVIVRNVLSNVLIVKPELNVQSVQEIESIYHNVLVQVSIMMLVKPTVHLVLINVKLVILMETVLNVELIDSKHLNVLVKVIIMKWKLKEN